MDVQAGTIDANGHTVATDLSGTAYSVFSEANSTLYITRSDNTSLQIGDKFPEFTDDQGNKITDGVAAQRDIENNGTQYSGDACKKIENQKQQKFKKDKRHANAS